MTNNIGIIDHSKTMAFVQEVNDAVQTNLETTGELISSATLLLDCITTAADNIEGFSSVRLVVDYRGFSIEYNEDKTGELEVLDGLYRALDVITEA